MIENYQQFLGKLAREHGDAWDPSGLTPQFFPYYNDHRYARVRVAGGTPEAPYVRTGVVCMTDGPRPSFALRHRRTDRELTDILTPVDLVVGVQDRDGGPYRDPDDGAVNWYRCAYCSKATALEGAAAGPWHWPGKGMVVNCKHCAGIRVCQHGHEYDSSESVGCHVCQAMVEYSDELAGAGRSAIHRQRHIPQSVAVTALHLLEVLGYGVDFEFYWEDR